MQLLISLLSGVYISRAQFTNRHIFLLSQQLNEVMFRRLLRVLPVSLGAQLPVADAGFDDEPSQRLRDTTASSLIDARRASMQQADQTAALKRSNDQRENNRVTAAKYRARKRHMREAKPYKCTHCVERFANSRCVPRVLHRFMQIS